MHETLFVAIASSAATLPALGVAVNRTTAHYLPRLSFFINSVPDDVWSQFQNFSMNIVRASAPDHGDRIHPMLMLRFIVENHMDFFDWFFLAPDSTYVRGRELMDFVKKISVGRAVYLGVPVGESDAGYCDFAAGILVSQGVMRGIALNLPWCMEHAVAGDFSASIGICVAHVFGIRCGQSAEVKFRNVILTAQHSLFSLFSAGSLIKLNFELKNGRISWFEEKDFCVLLAFCHCPWSIFSILVIK